MIEKSNRICAQITPFFWHVCCAWRWIFEIRSASPALRIFLIFALFCILLSHACVPNNSDEDSLQVKTLRVQHPINHKKTLQITYESWQCFFASSVNNHKKEKRVRKQTNRKVFERSLEGQGGDSGIFWTDSCCSMYTTYKQFKTWGLQWGEMGLDEGRGWGQTLTRWNMYILYEKKKKQVLISNYRYNFQWKVQISKIWKCFEYLVYKCARHWRKK